MSDDHISRADYELATRVLSCPQCHKTVTWTTKEDIICFCGDVCLNSFVIDQTTESKDEMLAAMGYGNNRDLENELEVEEEEF